MLSVKRQIPANCIYLTKRKQKVFGQNWRRWFFNDNILDISLSKHRRARVSKGSNKKQLQSTCFNFGIWRHSSVISSEKKRKFPNGNSALRSKVCRIFSKLSIKQLSVHKLDFRDPKWKFDLQNQKINSSFNKIEMSLNIRIDQFVYRSQLDTTILAFFRSKTLEYAVIS